MKNWLEAGNEAGVWVNGGLQSYSSYM